jgi:AcrR family transcriptional regulator
MLDTTGQERRRGLSAGLVAAHALDMVNDGGYEALTFRPLAKALNCEAMSLYHYFPSKAHLRDALVDLVLTQARDDTDAAKPWRERVSGGARAFRRALLQNPGMAPVLLTHRLDHVAGLDWQATFAQPYAASGLPEARVALYVRAVLSFVGGAVLDELRDHALATGAATPANLAEAAQQGADKVERLSIFNAGLGAILDRMEHEVTNHPNNVLPMTSRAELRHARRAARQRRHQQGG